MARGGSCDCRKRVCEGEWVWLKSLKSLIFKMKTHGLKNYFWRRMPGGGVRGGYGVRQISLIDMDLSFIPELSREIHQVQGTRETPVSCSLGSLPGSVVDGIKPTNKVMTDCVRLCKKYTRVMGEITSSRAG